MLFTGKLKFLEASLSACVQDAVQFSKISLEMQGAGAHQGNSISKCMQEMLFVSCFKRSVHSVGEKEKGEEVLYQEATWKQINWNLLAQK